RTSCWARALAKSAAGEAGRGAGRLGPLVPEFATGVAGRYSVCCVPVAGGGGQAGGGLVATTAGRGGQAGGGGSFAVSAGCVGQAGGGGLFDASAGEFAPGRFSVGERIPALAWIPGVCCNAGLVLSFRAIASGGAGGSLVLRLRARVVSMSAMSFCGRSPKSMMLYGPCSRSALYALACASSSSFGSPLAFS